MQSRLPSNRGKQVQEPVKDANSQFELRRALDECVEEPSPIDSTSSAPSKVESHHSSPPTSARPTGQRLVGALIAFSLLILGYWGWNYFSGLHAVGVVAGRIVELAPAWSGTVVSVYAREGDRVRQGDPLIAIHSLELTSEIARVQDDLRAARAELQSEVAKMALALQQQTDKSRDAWADFHLLQGDHQAAQAKLTEISSRLARLEPLVQDAVISAQEIVSIRFELEAQQAIVEHHGEALEARRNRANDSEQTAATDMHLKPFFTRIELLLDQLSRLSSRQERGTITAPFAGRVLEIHALVSEYVKHDSPIIEILQDETLEVVIQVKQRDACKFTRGQIAEVKVPSYAKSLQCRVDRIGLRYNAFYQQAPTVHPESKNTLSIHLIPLKQSDMAKLPVGAVVRLVRIEPASAGEPSTAQHVSSELPAATHAVATNEKPFSKKRP
jgi:HlyD family secretion protein